MEVPYSRVAMEERKNKGNTKMWLFFILIGIIMWFIIPGFIARCTGSNFNPYNNEAHWEPRHT